MNNEVHGVTPEARLLAEYPGVREDVSSLPEFTRWLDALRVVEIDGEIFNVLGGDQLKDHDQVVVEWVRRFRPELLGGEPIDGDECE